MYFDRIDIIEAHYAFACDYYDGQRSDLYARLCRIGNYYTPSPLWRGFKSLSDNAKYIYRQLKKKHKFK